MMLPNNIYCLDAHTGLSQLDTGSLDCIVTSPPYWSLRDYGIDPIPWPEINYQFFGIDIKIPAMEVQLGLENTVEEFVGHLVYIFREAYRALKSTGTLWLNIGDTYAAYWGSKYGKNHIFGKADSKRGVPPAKKSPDFKNCIFKPKDMVGIPWMVAFALREDGWYLRQDIIWHKPNPMPESIKDRCTKAHEYLFLFSKSKKYYFNQNAIMELASENSHARIARSKPGAKSNPSDNKNRIRPRKSEYAGYQVKNNAGFEAALSKLPLVEKRNKRDVWVIRPESLVELHTATFPQELVDQCLKAGCPENGISCDPFSGTGTTYIVSRKQNKQCIAFEISPKFIELSNQRIYRELGMFK